MPVYREFGLPNRHDKPLYKMVVVGVFGSVIPGTFYLLVGFYLSLHAWMNACAELMHFADRMFYKVRITVTDRQCYCYHTASETVSRFSSLPVWLPCHVSLFTNFLSSKR